MKRILNRGGFHGVALKSEENIESDGHEEIVGKKGKSKEGRPQRADH